MMGGPIRAYSPKTMDKVCWERTRNGISDTYRFLISDLKQME